MILREANWSLQNNHEEAVAGQTEASRRLGQNGVSQCVRVCRLLLSLMFTQQVVTQTSNHGESEGVFWSAIVACVCVYTLPRRHMTLKGVVWFAECCFVHVPQSFGIHSCLFDWICAPTLALKLSLNVGNIYAWFTTRSNFTCKCCFCVILLCI